MRTLRRARPPHFSSDLTLRSLLRDRSDDPEATFSSLTEEVVTRRSLPEESFDEGASDDSSDYIPSATSTDNKMSHLSYSNLKSMTRQRSLSPWHGEAQRGLAAKHKSLGATSLSSIAPRKYQDARQAALAMKHKSLDNLTDDEFSKPGLPPRAGLRHRSLGRRERSYRSSLTPSFLEGLAERVRSASPTPASLSSNPDKIIASLPGASQSSLSAAGSRIPSTLGSEAQSVPSVSTTSSVFRHGSRAGSHIPRMNDYDFESPRHHSSTSLRRVLSLGRSRVDSDVQSVVSEPVVYADSAHIADDIWIAPKELYSIERRVALKQFHKNKAAEEAQARREARAKAAAAKAAAAKAKEEEERKREAKKRDEKKKAEKKKKKKEEKKRDKKNMEETVEDNRGGEDAVEKEGEENVVEEKEGEENAVEEKKGEDDTVDEEEGEKKAREEDSMEDKAGEEDSMEEKKREQNEKEQTKTEDDENEVGVEETEKDEAKEEESKDDEVSVATTADTDSPSDKYAGVNEEGEKYVKKKKVIGSGPADMNHAETSMSNSDCPSTKPDPFEYGARTEGQDMSSRLIRLFFSSGSQNPFSPSAVRAAEMRSQHGSSRSLFWLRKSDRSHAKLQSQQGHSFRGNMAANNSMHQSRSATSTANGGFDGSHREQVYEFDLRAKLRELSRFANVRAWIRRRAYRRWQKKPQRRPREAHT